MRNILIKSNTYSYIIIRDFYLKPYEEGILNDDGLLESEYKSLLSLADTNKIIISADDYIYIKGKVGSSGGITDGYTKEEVNTLLETKLNIDGKAESAYVLSPGSYIHLSGGVSGSGLFTGEDDTTIETELDGLGVAGGIATLDSEGLLARSQLPVLSKSDVGLLNVDNTSDISKPISTLQQAALDLKVDKALIHEQFYGLSPTEHVGEDIDAFDLDFGVHLIRSDLVLNAPPNTKITCIEVRKTHDEIGAGGSGSLIPSSSFEQGTISESSAVGTDYEVAKYPPTEPLHGSRIRTINPIAITEYSTISIGPGFDYCVTFFDINKKYLGRSTFLNWGVESRLTYPSARFIAVAIKKSGATQSITVDDATAASLRVKTLGQNSGGSKQLVAWGALAGDLYTCVNIAGAWGSWMRISSPLPVDANDGDHVVFKNGVWVAEARGIPSYIEVFDSLDVKFTDIAGIINVVVNSVSTYKVKVKDLGQIINNTDIKFKLINNTTGITSEIGLDGTITVTSTNSTTGISVLYLCLEYKGTINTIPLRVSVNIA